MMSRLSKIEFFYDGLCLHRCVTDKLGNGPDYRSAFRHLFQVEGEIVRENYFFKAGRGSEKNLAFEVDRYAPLRKKMIKAIGKRKFDKLYKGFKVDHNKREKDQGEFGVILPKFNVDGTHEDTDTKHNAWDSPFWGGDE